MADLLPLPCVINRYPVLRSGESINKESSSSERNLHCYYQELIVRAMGSGPLRGSNRQQQQSSLPPWVSSVERTTSRKAGSVISDLVAPESRSAVVRAPIRVCVAKPTAMAGKDSSAFQNATHTFVVFGASVSCQI